MEWERERAVGEDLENTETENKWIYFGRKKIEKGNWVRRNFKNEFLKTVSSIFIYIRVYGTCVYIGWFINIIDFFRENALEVRQEY